MQGKPLQHLGGSVNNREVWAKAFTVLLVRKNWLGRVRAKEGKKLS